MGKEHYLLSQLIEKFGGTLKGVDREITVVAPLQKADAWALTFLTANKNSMLIEKSKALSFIVGNKFPYQDYPELTFILTADPYLYMARVSRFLNPRPHSSGKKHASAVIESPLVASVEIGAQVVISPYVEIGENTRILAGTVIEEGVKIGRDCLIHPHVTIRRGVKIGDRVEIHSGAVIGDDGFGLANNQGAWEKIPQIGSVEIEDDVEIGSNTCIDRGTFTNTCIRRGAKIDNLVQVGHNCEIGEHTAIAAMAGFAGSTIIGKYCRIAGAAKFSGHLKVADKTFIAGASVVSKSLHQSSGAYAGVYPLEEYQEWRRNAIYLKKLREMVRRLEKLEKKNMKERLSLT